VVTPSDGQLAPLGSGHIAPAGPYWISQYCINPEPDES
jgi:hypothetical protein